MNRESFQADIFGPDRMDHTPNEIFSQHIVAMVEALSKVDTPEAAERKLAIQTVWRTAGRAGEPAFLSFEGLQWNLLHGAPCFECPQSKPSKLKFVPLVAGATRHEDWTLQFGDDLVLQRGRMMYDSAVKTWLLQFLQGDGASTKMSNIMKTLQPLGRSGAQQKYSRVAVSILPPAPTAAGVRHGAADTLCMSVPAELAVHTTGHDLLVGGALWEYLNGRLSLCIPGAICLAGFPPLPYGQHGKGPVRSLLVRVSTRWLGLVLAYHPPLAFRT